jgi:hypothetical protein
MASRKSASPEPVVVYPAPDIVERGEYLAGVGLDGAEVPGDLAAEWLAAGLVTLNPPAAEE